MIPKPKVNLNEYSFCKKTRKNIIKTFNCRENTPQKPLIKKGYGY
jgi:hypothetical protein